VLDRAGVQQGLERAVVGVGPGVVGQQPLGHDALLKQAVQAATHERGHGLGALVVEYLGVGQAAAVIDDRVHVLPAHAGERWGRSPVTA